MKNVSEVSDFNVTMLTNAKKQKKTTPHSNNPYIKTECF